MMFTEKAMKAAEEKFSRLLEKAGEKKREEILSDWHRQKRRKAPM